MDPVQRIGGDPQGTARRPLGFAPEGGQVDLARHGRGAREITMRDHADALHAHQRLCLQRRRHARAEELNGAHKRRVRQRREVHLKRQSCDSAEYFVVVSDLVDDLVRPADNQRPMRARLRVEVGASDRACSTG